MSNHTLKQSKLNLNKKDILQIMETDQEFLQLVYQIAEKLGYKKTISNQELSKRPIVII